MQVREHYVSGFFSTRPEAESVLAILINRGLPREQLQIMDADSLTVASTPQTTSHEVLTNILVDGAVGTVIGTGLGALAQVALVAANVSLFVASPLLAPLAMLGWGASLGALMGAAAGAEKGVKHKQGWLSDLVRDAIVSGQFVLVARTLSQQETAIVQEVVKAAVGDSSNVSGRIK